MQKSRGDSLVTPCAGVCTPRGASHLLVINIHNTQPTLFQLRPHLLPSL